MLHSVFWCYFVRTLCALILKPSSPRLRLILSDLTQRHRAQQPGVSRRANLPGGARLQEERWRGKKKMKMRSQSKDKGGNGLSGISHAAACKSSNFVAAVFVCSFPVSTSAHNRIHPGGRFFSAEGLTCVARGPDLSSIWHLWEEQELWVWARSQHQCWTLLTLSWLSQSKSLQPGSDIW